jgi:hypothetical protein
MAKAIWNGWQTSVENAPQPVGIMLGRNLRKPSDESSEKPKSEAEEELPQKE